MNNFFFDQRLRRIEREGNDHLLMIQQFGAYAFSTFELENLLPKAQFEAEQIRIVQRRLLYLAVSNAIWVSAVMLCSMVGQTYLAYLFAAFVPFSVIVCIIGHRYLKGRYRTVKEEEIALTIILKELSIRENYLEA